MAFFPLEMFKMNSLLILLFISWISYTVSTVVIKGAPHLAVQANNFIFKCEVSGSDTFEAWKNPDLDDVHNSTGFEYSTSGDIHKLKILNVEVSDGGIWTCVSKEGNDAVAILNVLVSEIGSAEKTQYLLKDSQGIIKVNILGYPKPSFQWKRGKQSLNDSRYSIADNGSLLISMVDFSDQGLYSVAGEQGSQEQVIDGISVYVRSLPSFYSEGVNVKRTRGGNITFECNATGVPVPSISWKHGSLVINDSVRRVITASGLIIKNIEKSDVGKYSCVASNIVGTTEQTSKLSSVLVPPNVQPISDREVEKGEELKVYCNVSGDPSPGVEWLKNGSVLPGNQQIKDSGGSMLKIKNVQPSNSGIYECFAKNGAVDERGKEIVQSQSMKVHVIYPPEFYPKSLLKKILTSPDKRVEIECSASGNPAPNVSLSFGNKNLEGTLRKESTGTSLTVSFNVTESSLGVYICTASNKLKEIENRIKVSIPLDIPKIFNVESGCKNVDFSWRPDTKAYIKIKKFVVTLNNSNAVKYKKIYSGDVSQSSFAGLEENTKYYLSVRQVTDITGIGHTSTKAFETRACDLQKINNLVTGNEIRLSWPLATVDVDQYIVKYRIKHSQEWQKREVAEVTVKISGLDYGATYEFQVFIVVAGDESAYTLSLEKEIAKADTKGNQHYKTTERPEPVARKEGLTGGAIAAIVIVIILLVLIAVDVFCCFFNQCGVVHMCAAACAGKSRSKYNVDGHNSEEGTELKGNEESKEPVA